MGLDGVELVMATEEAFGVTITNAEAEATITPAHLIDLVFKKLRTSEERVCIAQRAFYLLRKALLQTLDVPRRSVTPNADVRLFMMGRPERETWSDLKNAVKARSWPALVRPQWMQTALWMVSAAAFLALLAVFHWAFAALLAAGMAYTANLLTQELRSRVPVRFCTVSNLVPFAMTSDVIAWRRDQVASLVKKTVVEQLGLREGQYREDAEFVKDFGMD